MLPLAPAPPRSLLPHPPTASLSFNNSPHLPFLSLRLLIFHFSLFLYSSCLRSLCPIGIRVGDDISVLQVHPHHHGKSYSFPSSIFSCSSLALGVQKAGEEMSGKNKEEGDDG